MKQKLVFFLGGSKFSGAEKRIFLTALHISKLSLYDVVLFIRQDLFDSIKSHDKFSGYDLDSLRIISDPVFGSTRTIKRMSIPLRYLKRLAYVMYQRPKLVHFTLYNFIDLYLARVIKLLGGKVFFEVTSPDVAITRETQKLIKNTSICDVLICVSKNVRRMCLEKSTNNRERILLREHPFVDIEKHSLSFDNKKNQVLYSHRLIQRKNPILALDAFAKMAKKHPDWHFVICGSGDLEEEIKQTVMVSNLPNLIFKGYEVNMSVRLQESKIFVSLIEPDNYPSQSVIEALASGCALLLSNTGQSEDKFLSKQNANGCAVDLDVALIEQAIETMIFSNQLEMKCQNSISHFNDAFSLDAYLDESISLYSNVTNKK